MNVARAKKITPSTVPSPHLDSVISADPLFFQHVTKAAGLARKEIQFNLRVSATTVDRWFNGTLHDPLTRARDFVGMFRQQRAVWLIPSILEYVAGSDFSGTVLDDEKTQALKVLMKGMKE